MRTHNRIDLQDATTHTGVSFCSFVLLFWTFLCTDHCSLWLVHFGGGGGLLNDGLLHSQQNLIFGSHRENSSETFTKYKVNTWNQLQIFHLHHTNNVCICIKTADFIKNPLNYRWKSALQLWAFPPCRQYSTVWWWGEQAAVLSSPLHPENTSTHHLFLKLSLHSACLSCFHMLCLCGAERPHWCRNKRSYRLLNKQKYVGHGQRGFVTK